MKKYHLFLILTLLCLSVHAQKQSKAYSEEEFRAKKQAYLTEQAGLTPKEAAQFFPLYYKPSRKKLTKRHGKLPRKVKNRKPLKRNTKPF